MSDPPSKPKPEDQAAAIRNPASLHTDGSWDALLCPLYAFVVTTTVTDH